MAAISDTNSNKWSTGDQQEVLSCDICLEPYDERGHEAKFLACHHTFCISCLMTLSREQDNIECPSCRSVTHLSDSGIPALQTNFYITYMQEIFSRLGTPKVKGCQRHSNQPLSFFCQTCGTPICRDCTIIDHPEVDGHDFRDIMDAEYEQRKSLEQQIDAAEGSLIVMETTMQALDAEVSNLSITRDRVKEDIERGFEKHVTIIAQRKKQLIQEIDRIIQQKTSAITNHREEIHKMKSAVGSSLDYCSKLVKRGALVEVVKNLKSLKDATDEAEIFISNLDLGNGYMQFDSDYGMDGFNQNVSQIGKIKAELMLPSSLLVKEMGTLKASIQSHFSLIVRNFKGELLDGYPIGVKIVDPSNTHINCELLEDHSSTGVWHVSFRPQISGAHKVVVLFLGQPIKGPDLKLNISSNNPVAKFGQNGLGNGKFNCPRAVALDMTGNIYVADTGNRLIQKLDPDGGFIQQFMIDGGNEECSTCDLAINKSKAWIICTETHVGMNINPTMGSTVAVYNTDGHLQHKFHNKSMKCALCVACNKHGEIIISDYLVHSLFMYSEAGSYLRKIGHAGMFNHPAFIAVDGEDRIIVSDTNNDCIQVFDRTGRFLYQFGSHGSAKGQMRQPFGVATDDEHIVVVDSGNQRVQVFKKDGTFVSVIESLGEPFSQPRGITLTTDGHFLVADRDNHCIKKYRYK